MSDFRGCPHCKNQKGFAFGTCVDCGFNYLDGEFHFVEVWQLEQLPAYLIDAHAERTRNMCTTGANP